jgi:hypothetical protein
VSFKYLRCYLEQKNPKFNYFKRKNIIVAALEEVIDTTGALIYEAAIFSPLAS